MRYLFCLLMALLIVGCNAPTFEGETSEKGLTDEGMMAPPPPPAPVPSPPPPPPPPPMAAPPVASTPPEVTDPELTRGREEEIMAGAPVEEIIVADDLLDQLSEASLAFVMPDSANVKSKIRAQLLISIREMEEELAADLTVEGEEFTGRVLVSRVVLAKLTAPAFDVEVITPERQAVSQTVNTEWLWYLTPTKTGTHEVFLTITAFVYVDENNFIERHIRTFEKVILIDVEPQQVVEDWLAKYWQWFFTVLLLPVLRYLWKRYKK